MTVQAELHRTNQLISQVERLEGVASSLPEQDARREELCGVIEEMIRLAEPVRVVVAAAMLEVSDKTVREWVKEGVLIAIQERPRLVLDLSRLHEVVHLVRDLREAGKTAGLLDEVYRRLSDARWQEDADLAESLRQADQGQLIPARRDR